MSGQIAARMPARSVGRSPFPQHRHGTDTAPSSERVDDPADDAAGQRTEANGTGRDGTGRDGRWTTDDRPPAGPDGTELRTERISRPTDTEVPHGRTAPQLSNTHRHGSELSS